MAVTIVILAMTVTFSITMLIAMRLGYKGSQKIFTSLQVELIFRYLGKP